MKTKGRFIAILAVLSLLVAMLPVLTVKGAVAGTATLTGGVVVGVGADQKTYFSDKTGFNIVTATVTDADLSPLRSTSVRFANVPASTTVFAIPNGTSATYPGAIIAGESSKTDTFTNDGTGANQTFTLTKGGADRANSGAFDGALTTADVTLKVSGVTKAPVSVTVVSNRITQVTLAAADNTVAIASGVTIEYKYTDYAPATLNIPGGSVTVFYGAGVGNETTQILSIISVDSSTGTITVGALPAIGLNDEVLINFSFEVQDTKTNLFTLSTPTSTALGRSRTLNATETGVSTNAFTNSVALFNSADLSKIETEAGKGANDTTGGCGDSDTIVQVDELNCTGGLSTILYDPTGTSLFARIQAASTALSLAPATTAASTFIARSLYVADGENVTVTYVDSSPSGTITNAIPAVVDLTPPTVTLVQPTQSVYTSITVQTMLARVADSGAGLNGGDIVLVQPVGAAGTPVTSLTTTGYDVSFSPSSALSEGLKTWYVRIQDKVGNVPANVDDGATSANEGTLGAAYLADDAALAGDQTASVNPFKFTVDTNGPVIQTAHTGYYLKNPGVTSGSSQEAEDSNSRSWVRVVFDLGTGGAPLDSVEVTANDFRVAGVAPVSAIVNAKTQSGNPVGSVVYLQVSEMATDAKPQVQIVGELKDKAGNARTSGTITNAVDKLSPVLTVTPSVTYAEKTVTLTITSSETLATPPALVTRPTVPTCADVVGTTQTVSSVSLTSWSSTYTGGTGTASKQWIVVTGNDASTSTNQTIFGDACVAATATSSDVVVFQVDDAAPVIQFPAATATATEGSVWIVARFDEDEYTGDTHKGIAVVTATLNSVDVASEVFVSSTTTDETGAALSQTHGTVTLARNLAVGTYTYVIVVKDDAANSSTTFTHTLTVSAKAKFGIVLNPGVNLVSIPGTAVADGGNLNVALTGLPITTVVTYDRMLDVAGQNPWLTSTRDAATGLFTGDIAVLEPGKAYFITATARATVEILISQPLAQLPPTIQVKQGFNAIGFWSIAGTPTPVDLDAYLNSVKWTVAYTFDPTPGVGWTVLRPDGSVTNEVAGPPDTRRARPGTGYLLFVTEDGTLTP